MGGAIPEAPLLTSHGNTPPPEQLKILHAISPRPIENPEANPGLKTNCKTPHWDIKLAQDSVLVVWDGLGLRASQPQHPHVLIRERGSEGQGWNDAAVVPTSLAECCKEKLVLVRGLGFKCLGPIAICWSFSEIS